MRYLLDTNICIYLINKKPIRIIDRLRELEVSEIGISTVTLSELEYGVEKSQRKDVNRLALINFIAPLEILSYDDLAARHYGGVRAGLESRGELIGPLDLLIAAHARSLGCTLVTNNTREFRRIPDLKIENWAA